MVKYNTVTWILHCTVQYIELPGTVCMVSYNTAPLVLHCTVQYIELPGVYGLIKHCTLGTTLYCTVYRTTWCVWLNITLYPWYYTVLYSI